MPHLFLTVPAAILAADLLWWWRADRLSHPLSAVRSKWRRLASIRMVFAVRCDAAGHGRKCRYHAAKLVRGLAQPLCAPSRRAS
jgi:hypothetical protein